MRKDVAIKLKKQADEIAKDFSRPDREFNVTDETFEVQKIVPLSESTAIVLLKKSSNKYAVAFCYYLNMNNGVWRYFFPTYDHCIGMESVKPLLAAVEKTNFSENF